MAELLMAGLLLLLLPCCYSKLQVVVVLPLEHGDWPTSSWERGLEILPGAQLAIEHINQDHDILPGNQLELVVIDSGRCRKVLNKDLLIDFMNLTFYQDLNPIGIAGLLCSNSEQLLSNLATHMGINLTVLSSSALVMHDAQALVSSHHYRMLQSADIFVDAFSSLITHLGWSRIAVVTESTDTYFFSVAEALHDSTAVSNAYNVIPFIQFHEGLPLVQVFQELQRFNSRIIFLSASISETIDVLCGANDRGLTWPDYAWIVHSISFADLEHVAACNIYKALEGIIMLEHRLSTENIVPSEHYTWSTYNDYYRNYIKKLAELSSNKKVLLRPNLYANLLHDSIWVYALALHSQMNASSLQLPDSIKKLSFYGIVGSIHFNNNSEVRTGVDIFQAKNGTPVHEGYYNPTWKNITFMGSLLDSSLPSDKHEIITDRASIIYTSILSLVLLVCVIVVTLIIVLYMYYRKEPEIKSTSVTLSLLMFLGCYIIFFYLLLAIIYTQSLVPSTSPFNICTAIIWLSISGISLPLILATLLVKMLRVFHIFTLYGKIGRMCSDAALLVYVLLLISPCILVLILWWAIDPYAATTTITEHPGFTEIEQRCYSKYLLLWFGILIVNMLVLIVVLVIVAVKTRKIRRAHFKDTKKVNAFLFVLLTVIFLTFSYWMIFRTISAKKGYSDITLHIAHIIIVASCQGFLFIPKILPPLKRSLSGQEGLFSSNSSKTQTSTITLTVK